MKTLIIPVFLIFLIIAGCSEDNNTTDATTVNFEMVLVPAGSFEMGCVQEEGNENEFPVHTVNLSSFYISNLEITQEQYETLMGEIPGSGYGIGKDNPVFKVPWGKALDYCNRRSEAEGLTPCYDLADSTCNWAANGYRLPTEAEWEYTARGAGLDADYAFAGSDEINRVAWYLNNSRNQTHIVGSKEPNSLGLYDMTGNVWEWCWDWYGRNYYSSSPADDPTGPEEGLFRVVRGGCWYSDMPSCCCSFRPISQPFGSNYIGFRIVRNAG
ncbi:MAG: formylglycine-generating enzyme family protein [Candidatus Cloacimonetes bacterium]|nr:formylglycine-generating enzyme family protein [Candidatus Cloacimonadota bacterium]